VRLLLLRPATIIIIVVIIIVVIVVVTTGSSTISATTTIVEVRVQDIAEMLQTHIQRPKSAYWYQYVRQTHRTAGRQVSQCR
jgi:hypothetical protein